VRLCLGEDTGVPGTVNAEGLVALRRSITDLLATADDSDWNRPLVGRRTMVRELVARIAAAYEAIRDGRLDESDGRALDDVDARDLFDLPPALLLTRFEEVATEVEARYAGNSDERWELSKEAFNAADGTVGMFLQQLTYDLFARGCQIAQALEKPFSPPPEAVEAAGAALVWWLSGKVEVPIAVELDGGELMLGAGEPVATITTDVSTLLAVAAGTQAPAEAAEEGKWIYAGASDQQETVEGSIRLNWGDPEIEVAGD
jgi:hypothetical protein